MDIDLDQFRPLAFFLANRIAWVSADIDDLVEEGILELHRALSKQTKPIRSMSAFASTVLSRKMKDYYPQSLRNRPPDISLQNLDLPDPTTSLEERLLGEIELATFLEELSSSRGPLSRWVAEQLLFPGHEVGISLLLDPEVLETLFEQYPNASPPHELRKSRVANHRQLRDILGTSVSDWFSILKGVRVFTLEWMESRGYDLPPGLLENFSS